ncbi:MAG: helicase-related protein [Armatimonadota bacterium]|nr:helicase-related protein [Armatimonadota bacterium]
MTKGECRLPSLRSVAWKEHLRAPDSQLVDDLYGPALERAVHYDRCCAYFSSSVLAAASRGFGGLIRNILQYGEKIPKPAVRLLVNEQLDSQDMEALLSTGDYEPLIRKLLKQFKTPKDVLEHKRLEALAWLVANGWLEVRVGLMRRTSGMLHAKYGIVRDSRGNALAFMGSGNETREGLLDNYEELRLFRSWKEKSDTDYYQDCFEKLWADRDEHVMTIPLPEAVKAKLIKLAPVEAPTEEPRLDKKRLEAAMVWKFISRAPYLPDGETACDATAPVDMWPHQRKVVEDTARAFPAGRLLCDEVGMGKTIEAILVLRRLLCGRGVKRALLLVPAGLLKQWQDELREKGGLLVPRWEDGYLYRPHEKKIQMEAAKAFAQEDVLLVSREWARLESNRQILLAAPRWDLVLMDEAHAARRRWPKEGEFNTGNLLLELLREMQLERRTRGIILLSATPMQTNPWEPWDLLSVLGVGGNWMVEFADIRTYYDVISKLEQKPPDWHAARTVEKLVTTDKEFPEPPKKLGGRLSDALEVALPDERKQYAQWLRCGSPLWRRMHRNTRETLREYHRKGFLDYDVPNRDVQDVIFDYTSASERDCYDAVKRYIDTRFARLEGEKSGKGLVMTIYRRRAASSPYALRRSMERRLEACEKVIRRQWLGVWRPEDEQLDLRDLGDADIEDVDPALPATPEDAEAEKKEILAILDKLNALGNTDSKFAKFREVLAEVTSDGRAALVFTEYYDTMQYLREQLEPIYTSTLGCFSGEGGEIWHDGKWVPVSKGEITERLKSGELKVLVCTDAASEGLNLQAASALINYDLPWNPSKVEQRIGRIDRIGQVEKKLPIRNMFLKNSVDMRVYQVLRERIGLFHHFVGRMQPVLSLAREALRNERAEEFLDSIDRRIKEIESDSVATSVFKDDGAQDTSQVEPILKREDIEWALSLLEGIGGKIKAKKLRNCQAWSISGLGKTECVSVSLDVLEKREEVKPVTPGTELVDRLSKSLDVPDSRMPLVVAEFADGAFRAAEARWVQGERVERVRCMKHLRELMSGWDGLPPAQAAIHKASEEARAKAERRVQEMKRIFAERERYGIESQVLAARNRLLRELARTLRCIDAGDLISTFNAQCAKENRSDGRYRRANTLLGGLPAFSQDELAEIDEYVRNLKEDRRKVRITGTEIDAAINDPRWRAKKLVEADYIC